jgi:DNA gyrase subunit B
MAEYGASNIKVLKGLEAVRKRPGMYIGDTSTRGLHHLVYEVVDNSIDEAMAGFCDTIKVTLTKNGSAIIEDNGRGIPVGMHPTEGISAATVVLTVLHAGGKFDKDTYKVSGGLHGVGVSVVNALSKDLHLTVFKEGEIYEQDFKAGIPQEALAMTGTTRKKGTKIEFWADETIFTETTTFQKEILMKRFKELAYLNPKITIDFRDERDGTKELFHFEGGIQQFVEDMNTKEPLSNAQFFQGKSDDIEIDIALMYCDADSEKSLSFVNNIKTADGGTHEAGFRAGLTRSMSSYISKNANAKEKGTKITGEDCKEGLIAIISVRVPEPQFEGQTKGKLGSSYVRPLVQKFFSESFNKYLEENPLEAKAIMGQILLAARGRDAAKRAKDLVKRKDSMSIGTLPGKLADCQSKDPELSEIYLVEGDSAGGCFTGDTKIKCANGENISIEVIAEEFAKGKEFFVYTYNRETSKIVLEKITNAWQTKITEDLLYITLDNGKRERCTSDHRWLLKDGTYREAKDLEIDISLMSSSNDYKVTKIEKYTGESIPVYDIEVPNTHNFALSSGVFVHNSAKQGRDRVFQAILPLKGKILNVEKARLEKILKSDEIKNMITALGCGIGEEFNEDKLRYHKVIIMTDADVDGCLRGDTKVKLLDGTYESMEKLAETYPSESDKFWVWASDKSGNPVPAKAHSVRVTKKVKKLYKITLDNDFVIEATDNHPFRVIDGRYVRADELVEGESLMPIYYKTEKDGFYPDYELLKIGKKWIPTHKYINALKDEKTSNKSEYVTHHIDHDKTNNVPENLTFLTRSEHSKLHGKNTHLINEYNGSEQQSKDLKENWDNGVYDERESHFLTYNKSEEHSQSVSENNRENWKDDEYRERMIEQRKAHMSQPKVAKKYSKLCESQWKNDDIAFRMQMTRVVNVAKKAINQFGELNEESYQAVKPKSGVPNWSTVFNKYEFKDKKEFADYVETYNHKIKSIEIIEVEETPVYDLTVDKYHNFAIQAGEGSSIFVHNSHIQTLLMTFFYRFLKPVIEKGYLYLAQPPLYRYKKGKNETYLKDDKSLNDFLIEHGIGVLESETMGKQDLTELFKLVAYYKSSLAEIEKRFALPEVVRYMIENPDVISTDNSELAKRLEDYINGLGYNILNKSVNEEQIQLFVQTNDGLEELIVDDNLFTSAHYNEAIYLNQKIQDRITDEFKEKDILELLNAVNGAAKKGAYIQRYKGLGEMNPEQLWETTMNPDDRRLLKVVIDDDELASDTFVLFMGDEVEPRRNYIETHAKDVKHLDV